MKHNRNGRRVTYRPGKTAGVFGIIWGGIFVLIGIFVAIPHFGAFGILWTLMALAITAFNGYQAFGKGYQGPEIYIDEDGEPTQAPPAGDTQQRLEQLRTLYDQRLITQEEYDEKRKQILEEQ